MISSIIAIISIITVLSVTVALVYQGNNMNQTYNNKFQNIMDQINNVKSNENAINQLNSEYITRQELAKNITSQEIYGLTGSFQNLSTNSLSTQDLSTQSLRTRNLTAQDLTTQGLTTQDLTTQSLTTQGLTTQDLTTKKLRTQDLTAQNLTTQELRTQGLSTRDLSTNKFDASTANITDLKTANLIFDKNYNIRKNFNNLDVQTKGKFNIVDSESKSRFSVDTDTNDLQLKDFRISQKNDLLEFDYLDTQNNLMPIFTTDKKKNIILGSKANQIQIGTNSYFSLNGDNNTYIRAGTDKNDINIGDKFAKNINIGNSNSAINFKNNIRLNNDVVLSSKKNGGVLGTSDEQNALQWNRNGEIQIGPNSFFPKADSNMYLRPGADGKDIYIGDTWAKNVILGQPSTNIDVKGSLNLNNRPLVFGSSTSKTSGIGYFDSNTSFNGFGPSGPVMYGENGGGLGSTSAGPRTALQWNRDNQVETNNIRFSQKLSGYSDNKTDKSEIANDTSDYQQLMIVGNKSGGTRKVGIWDELEVNGNLSAKKNLNTTGEFNAMGPINAYGSINAKGPVNALGGSLNRAANAGAWNPITKKDDFVLINSQVDLKNTNTATNGISLAPWNGVGGLRVSGAGVDINGQLNVAGGNLNKAPGPGNWNPITKKDDLVIINNQVDLKNTNPATNGISLAPWNGVGGLRVSGAGVDVNGSFNSSGAINATGAINAKSTINATGPINATGGLIGSKVTSAQGYTVTNNDPGPMIEKNYGSAGNRFGMGQFPAGTTRFYAGADSSSSSLNLSLAKRDNSFDDILSVKNDRSTNINGNFNIGTKFNVNSTSGNVGINQINPQGKLHVSGNILVDTTLTTGPLAQSVNLGPSEVKFRGDGKANYSFFNQNGQFSLNNTTINSAMGTQGNPLMTVDTVGNVTANNNLCVKKSCVADTDINNFKNNTKSITTLQEQMTSINPTNLQQTLKTLQTQIAALNPANAAALQTQLQQALANAQTQAQQMATQLAAQQIKTLQAQQVASLQNLQAEIDQINLMLTKIENKIGMS
jgi:hypothetical protein